MVIIINMNVVQIKKQISRKFMDLLNTDMLNCLFIVLFPFHFFIDIFFISLYVIPYFYELIANKRIIIITIIIKEFMLFVCKLCKFFMQ